MRIPWSAPTVSDATKLGLASRCPAPLTGERLYELLHQLVYSTDWPDATGWTEVDSGGNVNLAGGVWGMNGNGANNANGIYKTVGFARAAGYMEIKVRHDYTVGIDYQGFNDAAALGTGPVTATVIYVSGSLCLRVKGNNGDPSGDRIWPVVTAGTYYTLRIYPQQDSSGAWTQVKVTIQGGAEFPTETVVVITGVGAAWGATLYPQFQRVSANALLTYFKEFRWYSGYATDGPTLTYVADAGAGKLFNGLVFANLAAVGAWATTNVTFAYDYSDSATPSWSTEKTLAQLNALAALTTNKRYIHLRVTVNSDGATQQYAGELNADDGATILPALTTTIPTGLAIADRANGSGGLATITNIAAYANADEIIVTNSAGTTVIGRATKTEYTANSGIICPNVTMSVLRSGDKAKATSDLYVESAFSVAAADWTPTLGTIPTFSGITSLTDNADGTLTAGWGAATGEDEFELHVKAGSAPSAGEIAARTYLAGGADADVTSQRICNTAGGAKLTAGTTYYVAVVAINGAGQDGNTTALSRAPTNPSAVTSPTPVVPGGGEALLGVGDTLVFTMPATKKGFATVSAVNVDAAVARTVDLYRVRAGGSIGDSSRICSPAYSLPVNGAPLDLLVKDMQPGDMIRGLCSSANKVNVVVTTCEETIA